jgi:two-component system CheB/CheR fusion protein
LWVPGCASGEEAVSLAILVADLQWQSLSRRPIEILATDVKLSALRQARSFCYSAEQLRDLPEDMVERYFERQQGHFRLRQDLRDWLRFEHHDLAKDPPYLNLDLVSCRNVLMYFDPQLQELVLDKFRHGLNAGGLLFLGNSESVLQQSEGFETVHYPARLFRVH